MNPFFYSLLLLVYTGTVAAGTGPHAYELLTTRSGLNHNHVLSIAQDQQGYLWVGTRKGVCRYDGQEFIHYTGLFSPADNSLQNAIDVVYCTGTEVWVGTRTGQLSWLDTRNGTWENIRLPAFISQTNASGVKAIYKSKAGRMFIGLYDGRIHLLDAQKRYIRTTRVCDSRITGFGASGTDVLIFSQEIYRCDASGSITPLNPDVPYSITNASGICGDVLLFSPKIGEFLWYNTRTKHRTRVKDSFYTANENPVFLLNEQHVVIVNRHTLSVYDKEARLLKRIPLNEHEAVPKWELINAVLEDRDGNFWVGTDQGIVRVVTSQQVFRHFSANNRFRKLSHHYIRALYPEGNVVWAGTRRGYVNRVECLQDHSYRITAFPVITPASKPGAEPENVKTINSLVRLHNGELIAGGEEGLLRFNGKAFEPYRFPRLAYPGLNDYIWMVKQDRSGRIWISSLIGRICRLYITDSAQKHMQALTPDAMVWNMHEDRAGNIWLLTEMGLKKAVTDKHDNISLVSHAAFARNHLPGVKLWNAFEDRQGRLWLGSTDYGLICYNVASGLFTVYTEKHGLPSNTVSGLLGGPGGTLWISTVSGLAVMDLSTKKISVYSEEDGLISNDFNFKACAATASGELFWGTKNGMVSFFPDDIKPHHINSPVVITGTSIMGKETAARDTVVLRPGENMVTARFALLDHKYYHHYYRYLLHGFNTTWNQAGERNPTATYTNLPPGSYVLEIQAAIAPGRWLPQTRKLFIIVQPALWQNTWFIAAVLFSLVCLVSLVVFLRFRKVVNAEREKHAVQKKISELELSALQAQMNPHFIFNAIHSIQHFILKNDELSANEYLTKFASLMRLFLESSKRKLIPVAEETEIIKLYTQLEMLRFENRFDVRITVDPEIDVHATEIPSMLLQPFVENAIIHGLLYKKEPGYLHISMQKNAAGICCRIDDNGVGREASRLLKPARNHQSRGLELILDRVRSYNKLHSAPLCSIQITDKVNDRGQSLGTLVTIQINEN